MESILDQQLANSRQVMEFTLEQQQANSWKIMESSLYVRSQGIGHCQMLGHLLWWVYIWFEGVVSSWACAVGVMCIESNFVDDPRKL